MRTSAEYRANADLIARLQNRINEKVTSIKQLVDEITALKRRLDELRAAPPPAGPVARTPPLVGAAPGAGVAREILVQRAKIWSLRQELADKAALEARMLARRDQLAAAVRDAEQGRGRP